MTIWGRMLKANVTGQQYMYDAAYQPDLDKVLANHGIAISRYFTGPNPAFVWKRVTPQQVADTLGKGLGMVCNTEGSADPLSAADAAGVSYKQYGKLLAQWGLTDLARCGIPAGAGVADYFSVDVYTDPSRYPDVRDMFDGINEVIPPAGYLTKVYAQGGLIDYLCAQHRVDGKQWLAAPTSWPGYREALAGPNLAMVQLVGSPVAATDQNKILDPYAVGAYWPDGSPYGGDMSAGGPEHWDAADFDKFTAELVKRVPALQAYQPGAPDNPSVATVAHYVLGIRDGDPGHNDLGDIRSDVAKVSQQVAGIPTGGPTSFTMTGQLDPKPSP